MRKAFIEKLIQIVKKNKNIFLLTGDVGFSLFDEFKESYPDNYLNVGVSESNMIGMAAGLALAGKQVFVYSIIPFITFRCLEQIRNDLCYQRLPVKIIGVGEGLAYGAAGATHHALEDIAVMSALPEMIVIAPADPMEVSCAVENSLKLTGPCYIRIAKTGEPVSLKKRISFKIGKAMLLEKGKDIALVSTGDMLRTSLKVSEMLKKENIHCKVINMHTLKPLDREIIIKSSNNTSHMIVSIEEHSRIGGLGSHIADVIAEENLNVKLLKIALPDKFIHHVGSQAYLKGIYDLSSEQITAKILNSYKR